MKSDNGSKPENKACAGFKLFCACALKSAVFYNDFEVQKTANQNECRCSAISDSSY